jgi:hypothetical protein
MATGFPLIGHTGELGTSGPRIGLYHREQRGHRAHNHSRRRPSTPGLPDASVCNASDKKQSLFSSTNSTPDLPDASVCIASDKQTLALPLLFVTGKLAARGF